MTTILPFLPYFPQKKFSWISKLAFVFAEKILTFRTSFEYYLKIFRKIPIFSYIFRQKL